jgi:hypothetical protein
MYALFQFHINLCRMVLLTSGKLWTPTMQMRYLASALFSLSIYDKSYSRLFVVQGNQHHFIPCIFVWFVDFFSFSSFLLLE